VASVSDSGRASGGAGDAKKAKRRRWAGIAFVVATVVAAAGALAVGLGGDLLGAGRGLSLAGVFGIAAYVRLRRDGESTPLLDILTLALAVQFVILLVAAG
jgi:hypothetical protein